MEAEKCKPSDLSDLPKHFHEDEDDMSQECKNLIAKLPTELTLINLPLHQYNGFWLSKKHIQGILNFQNHYQSHDSDIILVTFPKSGTTWLKALTFTILNRKTYHPNPNPNPAQTQNPHPLFTANPHELVPFIEYYDDLLKRMPSQGSFSSSPRLFACHVPFVLLPESVKQFGSKIVYLCRNPKDLFVSTWKFVNKLLEPEAQGLVSIEDAFEKFCRGVVGYGPFWDHMLGYHNESLKSPEKVMFLRFEELKSEPVKVVKNLAEFMGYGFSQEEQDGNVVADILKLCSFESLSNMEVNKTGTSWRKIENKAFFRRGEVGDWKKFFTPDMVEHLNVITEEKLEKHGLKF